MTKDLKKEYKRRLHNVCLWVMSKDSIVSNKVKKEKIIR